MPHTDEVTTDEKRRSVRSQSRLQRRGFTGHQSSTVTLFPVTRQPSVVTLSAYNDRTQDAEYAEALPGLRRLNRTQRELRRPSSCDEPVPIR